MTAPGRAASPLRIVVALDSFKGSVTSAQACTAVREGVLRAAPDAVVTTAPIADGGEGTLDALAPLGRPGSVETIDLLGRPLTARHVMIGNTAVIESATTVGLDLLDDVSPATARSAHSYGLGLQLARVMELENPSVILVGLGGTGCTDGGTGALLALGAKMWNFSGNKLFPGQRIRRRQSPARETHSRAPPLGRLVRDHRPGRCRLATSRADGRGPNVRAAEGRR